MHGSHLQTTHYPIVFSSQITKVYAVVHTKGTIVEYDIEKGQPRFYASQLKNSDMKTPVIVSHIHDIQESEHFIFCGCLTHNKPPLKCCEEAAELANEYDS